MKELCGTARNYMLIKTTEEHFTPSVELILIVSEPHYKLNIGNLDFERQFQTIRVCTSRVGVRNLIKTLVEIDSDFELLETQEKSIKPE